MSVSMLSADGSPSVVSSAGKESSSSPQETTTVCRPVLSETISQPVVVGAPKDDEHLANAIGVSHNSGALELPAALPALHFTDSVPATQVTYFRRNSRIQFAALCWCLFLGGWNDGSTGPLLPAIQQNYHIGFIVVSLLFVVNFTVRGFIVGALANVWLDDKLGFGKVMVLGSICQLATYIIQSPAPPFPVMAFASGIGGFGVSLQDAQANGFVGSLKQHMPMKLGMMHASYGLGAFVSPLAATHFSRVRHWSFHYIISASMALANTINLLAVFRGRSQSEILAEAGQEAGPIDPLAGRERGKYRQILGIRAVQLLGLFAFIHLGISVTVGGWIVTFIIDERNGGRNAGYISSGFAGGITLGRLCLMWLTRMVGESRVIFLYALLAIGLEVTIWVVPSIVENAIAISVIGLLQGPMYPILISHASKVLPARLLTGALGCITGIGVAGSAAFPFVTGVLASRYGIGSLQPLLVAMMSVMVGVWALVPKSHRRID